MDGQDVAGPIRTREVSNAVSAVAALPEVREYLIAQQRQIIAAALEAGTGIVAEGRDIGSVVAPDAEVKVFLTASEAIRARRRSADLAGGPAGHRRADPARAGPPGPARRAADGQGRRRRRDRHHRAGPGRGHRRDRRAGPQPPGGAPWLSPASRIRTSPDVARPGPRTSPAWTSLAWTSPARPVPVLAVVGRPNVGKSTMVNRILGSRQAVVEDTPGVTRDRVTYDATWRGPGLHPGRHRRLGAGGRGHAGPSPRGSPRRPGWPWRRPTRCCSWWTPSSG